MLGLECCSIASLRNCRAANASASRWHAPSCVIPSLLDGRTIVESRREVGSQTRTELVDLHSRLGATFIYVTHDQVEAMTMADRVAIMDGGRLQQLGSPQAVYDRPANLFVARFVGSPPMNIISGVLEPGADGVGGGAARAGVAFSL